MDVGTGEVQEFIAFVLFSFAKPVTQRGLMLSAFSPVIRNDLVCYL